MSATERRRGIRWEQALARHLRDHGYPHAETAPRGENQPHGDIVGIPHLYVEAKNTREHRLGAWLDKARANAGDHRAAVVIVKRRGHANPGAAFAVVDLDTLLALLEPPHQD